MNWLLFRPEELFSDAIPPPRKRKSGINSTFIGLGRDPPEKWRLSSNEVPSVSEYESPSIFDIVNEVLEVLEQLGVPYYVGGSLASMAHGVVRLTQDADLVVVDLLEEHAHVMEEQLRERFYVDADMIRDAVRDRSSFNLIHLDTMFKVDIFVRELSRFVESVFQRRQALPLSPSGMCAAFFASPEDIVLLKLVWYREGGEVSERQWSDVLGVLKVHMGSLDFGYLQKWAHELNVADLLDRACREAGTRPPGTGNTG